MKITDLKLRELNGVMEHPDPFWEKRLVRPQDIYPEYRKEGADYSMSLGDGRYAIRATFLEIHTDDGVVGLSGPCSRSEAFVIDTALRPLLVGKDPLAIERLWDVMYRSMIHGRKGETMMAISVVDCGLWDLKGKELDVPVYTLLGGPTRTQFPAYASALGFSIDPEDAADRAKWIAGQGYTATKWFFRDGPTDGRDGERRNLELARTLREAVGDDVDIMLDAWSSWNVPIRNQDGEQARRVQHPLAGRARNGRQAGQLRRDPPQLAHRHLRRRARVHSLGIQAGRREVRDGRAPAGHLLVRRHQRNGEDMRPGVRVRPSGHTTRPQLARNGPRHSVPASDHHAHPGIPHQVERRPPVLSQRPTRAGQRDDHRAGLPRPRPRDRRVQGGIGARA